MYSFLKTSSIADLKRWFEASAPHESVDPVETALWWQEVAIELIRRGSEHQDYLLGQFDQANDDKKRAVILALSFCSPLEHAGQALVHRSVLCSSNVVAAEAIDALTHLRDWTMIDVIRPFLSGLDQHLVRAALDHVAWFRYISLRDLIEVAVRSPFSLVRMSAYDLIDDMGLLYLSELAGELGVNDDDPSVKEAAEGVVANLVKYSKR
jgi:hypothetical protein